MAGIFSVSIPALASPLPIPPLQPLGIPERLKCDNFQSMPVDQLPGFVDCAVTGRQVVFEDLDMLEPGIRMLAIFSRSEPLSDTVAR